MSFAQVWSLLPGDPPDLNLLKQSGTAGFRSAFEADRATLTSVSAAALAIAELGWARGLPRSEVRVSGDVARASFVTHLEIDGVVPPTWADLSGYYATRDNRFVQLHCNFPHHAAGVVAFLGGDAKRATLEAAAAGWNSDELEAALVARNMIAAKLRTMDEWDLHPHALATRELPLISLEKIGEAEPRPLAKAITRALDGIRVLDCSRVLAGPVAGQMLAAHGADVLRIGSPSLPAVEVCVQATGAGKRNAFVDLDSDAGQADMTRLMGDAHVWIDAYRPGSLTSKGFSVERAAELNPGIVAVQLSAFDWVGPWAGRRGFDSIVQSTTGLVDSGSSMAGRETPTPLPAQVLDHATGQLAAFAAARALQHQSECGGSWRVRLSLLRTRNWLVGLGAPKPFVPQAARATASALHEVNSHWGRLTLAKAPTGSWRTPPMPLGSADPVWLS